MFFCDDSEEFSPEASELEKKLSVLLSEFIIDSNFENLRKGIDNLTNEINELTKNEYSPVFACQVATLLDEIDLIDECYRYLRIKDKNQKSQLEKEMKKNIGWYGGGIDTLIKKSIEFGSI